MHAEICPICGGKGKIKNSENTCAEITCPGCNGRCWIEVSNGQQVFPHPFYVPQPYIIPYTPNLWYDKPYGTTTIIKTTYSFQS